MEKAMRRYALPFAAALVAGALGSPATASADDAMTTVELNLRAGPSTEFPVVDVIPDGGEVDIHGCVKDYQWCDVTWRYSRGWVYADYLRYYYDGAYVPLIEYGPRISLPIVSFSIGTYWDDYYSGKPWFHQRARWRDFWQGNRHRRAEHHGNRREGQREGRADRRDNERGDHSERRQERQEKRALHRENRRGAGDRESRRQERRQKAAQEKRQRRREAAGTERREHKAKPRRQQRDSRIERHREHRAGRAHRGRRHDARGAQRESHGASRSASGGEQHRDRSRGGSDRRHGFN
jgi:uncharacterized protein YraI